MKKQKLKPAVKKAKAVSHKKAAKSKRPVRKVKSSVDAVEEKAMAASLHRISVNARRRAYSNNASVTIIREGKLIKVYRGKEEVIGEVAKPRLLKNIPSKIKIR